MKHNVFYSLFLGMTGFVFCWDLEKGGDGHSPTVTVEPWKPYGSRFPGTVEPNRGPRFHGSTVWRIHGARSFLHAASWHQGHLDCSVRLRCLPVCRRLCRALRFALLHANGDYPVVLTKVTKVSRTRKYFFQTSVGKSFTLFSCHVPLRFQQKFGTSMLEPESRECQVKARTGHQQLPNSMGTGDKSQTERRPFSGRQTLPNYCRTKTCVHAWVAHRSLLLLGWTASIFRRSSRYTAQKSFQTRTCSVLA